MENVLPDHFVRQYKITEVPQLCNVYLKIRARETQREGALFNFSLSLVASCSFFCARRCKKHLFCALFRIKTKRFLFVDLHTWKFFLQKWKALMSFMDLSEVGYLKRGVSNFYVMESVLGKLVSFVARLLWLFKLKLNFRTKMVG